MTTCCSRDHPFSLRRHGRPRRSAALAAGLLAALLGCAGPPAAPPAPPALGTDQIERIVASPDRSAADRTNDARRKPVQLLAFIDPRPGMTALDVSAGGGYTTELLARAIGPTGRVYGQSPPRDPARVPAQPEGGRGAAGTAAASAASAASTTSTTSTMSAASAPSSGNAPPRAAPRSTAVALAERQQRLRAAGTSSAAIEAVEQRFDDPVPPVVADGRLDRVTLLFNYHDLGFLGVDRARMNRAIFRALKPGGTYVVADHAGRPGTGISESGSLHRIEEAFLRQEVEAAGFRFAAEADFLRNPQDPRDRNTPEPPQPKDDFVLKFVKP